MDLASFVGQLTADLNAEDTSRLVFWSIDELYGYADRALSKISQQLMLFVDYSEIPGVAGQGVYLLAFTTDEPPVDTRFSSLIYAAWSGLTLRPASVQEIEALDANWETANGNPPQNWIGNYMGVGNTRLYPAPSLAGTLAVICQRNGPAISANSTSLQAPDALGDLLQFRMLAEARSKRSDSYMPDAAAVASQIGDLLQAAFQSYYGDAF